MKGQISIEYVIIFVVLLSIFVMVSMPMMSESLGRALDVQRRDMNISAVAIINDAVTVLKYQGAGSNTTVKVMAPPGCGYDFVIKGTRNAAGALNDASNASKLNVSCDGSEGTVIYFGGVAFVNNTVWGGKSEIVVIRKT